LKRNFFVLILVILVLSSSGFSYLSNLLFPYPDSSRQAQPLKRKLEFKPGILKDVIIPEMPDMTIHFTIQNKISEKQIKSIDTWLTSFYTYICENAEVELKENNGMIVEGYMGIQNSTGKNEDFITIKSMEELNKVLQSISNNQIISYYIHPSVFDPKMLSSPAFTMMLEMKNQALSLTIKNYYLSSNAFDFK
jgi:hypothetical protein